ncbi:MAG TPA: GNAT family N-acetyltransferase [Candidatus Angelobacter sp.]|jgi:ribosomal protein S18 acetylase RimI-like enzyme
MTASLRQIRPDDQDFLFKLYASTRLHEIAGFGWPEAQQEMFLRMQFTAQQRWYESMYGQAEHQIVEQDGQPIGRLMVVWDKDFALLVDIALLAEHRGQGTGGELVRELIQQCTLTRIPLRLQVLKNNPALRLYERLGFIRTGEDQMYIQMERRPG